MTRTTTASSPKVSLKRSVSSNVADERLTSVSGSALGSSRSASPAPTSASRPTTPRTASGRLAASRTIPPKRSPIRGFSLGDRLRVYAGRYSIPSGPWASPERNCLTNWLSELNSSVAGPDSTIRPFHRTAMKSATRRADMMSWVITV